MCFLMITTRDSFYYYPYFYWLLFTDVLGYVTLLQSGFCLNSYLPILTFCSILKEINIYYPFIFTHVSHRLQQKYLSDYI